LKENNIEHALVATTSSKANGQVERVKLGKLTDNERNKNWCRLLTDIEHAINNTINKSTAQSPSKLLFGVRQREIDRWNSRIS